MEGAFTHFGNHLISDFAAAINAGDDLSTIDPDEALLYGQYGGAGGLGSSSRRRNDDDDNETEVFDDDDAESIAGMPSDGTKTLGLRGVEDEKELPAHACVYVASSPLQTG
jgi:regulator of nonsense transcripts 1